MKKLMLLVLMLILVLSFAACGKKEATASKEQEAVPEVTSTEEQTAEQASPDKEQSTGAGASADTEQALSGEAIQVESEVDKSSASLATEEITDTAPPAANETEVPAAHSAAQLNQAAEQKNGEESEAPHNGESSGQSSKADMPQIELTKERQRKANLFLSNFAEQPGGFDTFDRENVDFSTLVYFVREYAKINDFGNIKEIMGEQYYQAISLDYLNKVTSRFFGLTFTKQDAAQFKRKDGFVYAYYEDGYFYFQDANGAPHNYVSIVKDIHAVSENVWKIDYAVFEWSEEYWSEIREYDLLKTFYGMSYKEALKSSYLSEGRSRSAAVEVLRSGDTEAYHLLTY